jgi:serine/threonine-protein kinase
MLRSGTRIGPYEILGPLGAGGMGEVHRAHDTRLGRKVAIKVLPGELATDPDRLRRFAQEARATAALSHPNILAVFDVGSHEDRPYLVEELLEGETLRERLLRGALTVRTAVELAAQIADGLAAAHGRGIVHRDLKPDNLFVTTDGHVKILDFGLAKLVEVPLNPEAAAEAPTLAPGTEAGVVLGTPGYMAPEQVRAQPADHRADLFALGCVLYEMLAGKRPFAGTTSADTRAAILTRDPQPLTENRPEVSVALEQVVLRCVEKDPDRRFDSARDVAFALRAVAPALQPAGHISAAGDVQPQERPSIAVLPFANLSAEPEQEYFCDGVSEEIIHALAHVEGLRVVARTSSFAFKGRSEDIRQIGASLNVRTVLEGSVRKSGDRLRITAQLVDVADGCHLWSERFDRRLEDVFAIQDAISLAIVDHLKIELLDREKAAVVHRHTANLEAHNAYLIGLFEWNKMSPDGLARSRDLFREAIRLDPAYAPAYARLADAITSVTWWADQPPAEALSQALPLALKALELDPNLSHAFCVMGVCRGFLEWDRVVGEVCLRRAVELAPNDANAQIFLALLLTAKGSFEESVLRSRLAQRLDPLSPAVNVWAGSFLACAGHFNEALASLERQVAMNPQFWMPYFFIGYALARGGRLSEARVATARAVELSGGVSITLSVLACLCYLLGDRSTGDDLFDRLHRRAEAGYVAPMLLAWAHAARGDADTALQCVKDALAARDPWVVMHRLWSPAVFPAEPRVDALIAGALP